jgi:hypothetical protein
LSALGLLGKSFSVIGDELGEEDALLGRPLPVGIREIEINLVQAAVKGVGRQDLGEARRRGFEGLRFIIMKTDQEVVLGQVLLADLDVLLGLGGFFARGVDGDDFFELGERLDGLGLVASGLEDLVEGAERDAVLGVSGRRADRVRADEILILVAARSGFSSPSAKYVSAMAETRWA